MAWQSSSRVRIRKGRESVWERETGQWLECDWTLGRNVWLHSRFVLWDHSCGRCRIDWEQLFFFFFLLSVLRLQALALPALWGWAKGHVVGVLILCSLGVGTKRPQTQQCTPPVLLASEERDAARACQREWDWWQDVTSSWSHSRGTRGAVNDTGRGDCAGLKILLEGALIYCAFHWKLDCKSFKDNKGVTFFFKNEN